MRIALFAIAFWSTTLFAHDISLISQHLDIKKQNTTGWQHDVIARAVVSRQFDFGLQGTYFERFDSHENRFGAFVIYHPFHSLTLELRYLQGDNENEILPRNEYDLSAYYSLTRGFTPYFIYQDRNYSSTRLHTLKLGLEIETVPHFIIIPQVMGGRATFEAPAETEEVYSYGLRVMYYRERTYSFSLFAFRGKEVGQAVTGERNTNLAIDTLTGGASVGYFITSNLRGELIIDHTDYEQINNQFLTTTLNLQWIF